MPGWELSHLQILLETGNSLLPVEAYTDCWLSFPLPSENISLVPTGWFLLTVKTKQADGLPWSFSWHVWNFSQGTHWIRPQACGCGVSRPRLEDNSHLGCLEETGAAAVGGSLHSSALQVLQDSHWSPRFFFEMHHVLWDIIWAASPYVFFL